MTRNQPWIFLASVHVNSEDNTQKTVQWEEQPLAAIFRTLHWTQMLQDWSNRLLKKLNLLSFCDIHMADKYWYFRGTSELSDHRALHNSDVNSHWNKLLISSTKQQHFRYSTHTNVYSSLYRQSLLLHIVHIISFILILWILTVTKSIWLWK